MTLSAITISSSSSFTPYGISCSLLATGCLCSASCIRCLILVTIDIQVTMGFSIRQVILQEIKNYNVSWIVLDRHLWRDMRFHLTKIPCISVKGEYRHLITSHIGQKQNQYGFLSKFSDAPILSVGYGIRVELSIKESNRLSYYEI
ncbi:unnamed protein product [Lathyrus oleraceus]|uniref:Uncharacterized protein n=2 Tax=Pisum sativum TaxID=3888 RepID=A0A9D5B2J8_PEA|nr:uncharacterized protein LOC127128276 isoform X2 [Pisum sativum]XP_050913473.1 uncharacterized protein LOC127128276 isoform X2 [Pisum sativum]KAI5431453.1 hypothetical protein KIW84_035589 [Pisum sativum]